MEDESLRDAVERQASARVARDLPTFGSYMTPRALAQLLHATRGLEPRRFDIVDVDEAGSSGTSDVRYVGRTPYVIRQRWERTDGTWKTIAAERVDTVQPARWWRRLFGSTPKTASVAPEEQP